MLIRNLVFDQDCKVCAPSGVPNGVPSGDPIGVPIGVPNGDPIGVPIGVPNGVPSGVPIGVQLFALLIVQRLPYLDELLCGEVGLGDGWGWVVHILVPIFGVER